MGDSYVSYEEREYGFDNRSMRGVKLATVLSEGDGWLCDACAKTHGCDEEMFLPVVNSPRVGTCGYTGEAIEW